MEAYLWQEKALREALNYPPRVRMVKLEVRHRKEERAREKAFALLEALRAEAEEGRSWAPPPLPCPG